MVCRALSLSLLMGSYVLLVLIDSTLQCGPGRSYGTRKPRKTTPLVFKQHVPNVSENTLGASGPSEGKITRQDPRFKDLVVNNNPNIVFKDEEGTSIDRIMSQRCKDRLDSLAILVMNHWPGLRLRVIEVWGGGAEGDGHHPRDSLHREGRAVDLTTSDRDRAKYGTLGRLAVDAGFDWVYYESRGHIHCSVRSDSSIAVHMGGCFPSSSSVHLEDGSTLSMSRLAVGDRVLSVDQAGNFQFEPVIGFLHRSPNATALFWHVETATKQVLTLTPDHLLFTRPPHAGVADASLTADASFLSAAASFAAQLRPNASSVYVAKEDPGSPGGRPGVSAVARVTASTLSVGLYAPLTASGTVVVDGVVASCYAAISSHVTAHLAVAPLRLQSHVGEFLKRLISPSAVVAVTPDPGEGEGVHWYAQLLHAVGRRIIPSHFWFSGEETDNCSPHFLPETL